MSYKKYTLFLQDLLFLVYSWTCSKFYEQIEDYENRYYMQT